MARRSLADAMLEEIALTASDGPLAAHRVRSALAAAAEVEWEALRTARDALRSQDAAGFIAAMRSAAKARGLRTSMEAYVDALEAIRVTIVTTDGQGGPVES